MQDVTLHFSHVADVSADEDWEQDLDIELTEEDMKAAEELAKKMGENIDLEVKGRAAALILWYC